MRRGFTLIEMLVATALVVLIMILFAEIFQEAIGTVRAQRGRIANDEKAGVYTQTLRTDLNRATYRASVGRGATLTAQGLLESPRGIVALGPGDRPDPRQQGFVYISENDPDDDGDDILHLTVSISESLRDPLISNPSFAPYQGRAANQAGGSLNQPDADDGILGDSAATSRAAEVCYFLRGTTLYRRLPVQVTPCDPDMYLFLVRHPEVVVGIWEVMNISNVALARTGPDTFRASDNAGTLCHVKYCYSDHETQVIYAEGAYNGPMFNRPVRARCVLVLKSGYLQETDGRYYVTSRMDTFIEIDHTGVEILAKTLQMLIHRAADYNFVETAAFFATVSRTAEENPRGMQRLARKLAGVEPQVRDRFAEISQTIGEKAQERAELQTSLAMPASAAAR